jgi:hypothetical protein
MRHIRYLPTTNKKLLFNNLPDNNKIHAIVPSMIIGSRKYFSIVKTVGWAMPTDHI